MVIQEQINRLPQNFQRPFCVLFLFIVYYLSARYDFAFSIEPDYIGALCPPSAVFLIAFLLTKPKYWWYFFWL